MASDELSPINMPQVSWTTSVNSQSERGRRETEPEAKENNAKDHKEDTKKMSPDVEFEPIEHELDSIA